MGCDIHCYAEVKNPGTLLWEKVGKIFPNPFHRPGEENRIDEDGYEWNATHIDHPYRGRNYDLFAMLADVRNGRGFAGVKTGEGFTPIAEPKGVPDDVSPEIEKIIEERDVNGHSHSWLTVKELMDYNWDQITMHRGLLDWPEYCAVKHEGRTPESYCGDVWGPDVVKIEEDEAERILDSGVNPYDQQSLYVNYPWTELYRNSASHFLDETLPALCALGRSEDVRIVFFFDN